MRFIFLNPQKNPFFGVTVLNYFSKIYSTTKYRYLVDHLTSKRQILHIVITKNASSLPAYISRYLPINLEIYLWAIINKINPFKVRIIKKFSSLNQNDALFSLTFRNFDLESSPKFPHHHKFLKIFHISHFSHYTSVLAKNLKHLEPDILVAENNLQKNSPYFRKYFSFYKKNVYTLPFVFENRFQSRTPFSQRLNKCLATGSLAIITEMGNNTQYRDFEKYFKVDSLYPLRKIIFENQDKLRNYIDSSISKVFSHIPKIPTPGDNIIIKLSKSIYNGVSISKHKYYKFDIVQKYNEYKMFIVPEEINNLPAIGAVEGMACGCAYLGKIDPMYTDLGFIPNVHYIGYDGSLKDLIKKIAYFQNHPKQLEKIATAGYKFVTTKFDGSNVAQNFINDINNYTKNRSKINCSFTKTN